MLSLAGYADSLGGLFYLLGGLCRFAEWTVPFAEEEDVPICWVGCPVPGVGCADICCKERKLHKRLCWAGKGKVLIFKRPASFAKTNAIFRYMLAQQDNQLLCRLKKGDLTAFDELYLKYYKLLCTSAFFFLKNEQEAKDLVQTFFLDIWDKRLYLQFHDDVKGYLFRAIKNRCLNHLKWQKVQSKKQAGFTELQGRMGDPSRDTIEALEEEASADQFLRLRVALEDMPGQKKTAIQLVYMDGKKYQDAAATMRISINSLKTHLKTGLRLLRGEIKDKEK